MKKRRSESAVSPVVGVMLMLVVTIIIAAVVSAFAGNVGSGTDRAPNCQLKVGYSQSKGMWFENTGPDDLSTSSTNIWVRLSDSFGTAEHQAWMVNKTTITDVSVSPGDGNYWLRADGRTGVKSFKVGERHYVIPPYHTNTYLQPGGSATYSLSAASNQGNSFWVEMTDRNGKIFARTKVKIEA